MHRDDRDCMLCRELVSAQTHTETPSLHRDRCRVPRVMHAVTGLMPVHVAPTRIQLEAICSQEATRHKGFERRLRETKELHVSSPRAPAQHSKHAAEIYSPAETP